MLCMCTYVSTSTSYDSLQWLTMYISTPGSRSSPRNGSPPIPAWEAPAAQDPCGSEAYNPVKSVRDP